MDERQRRAGENEVLYREVNERVLELNERFGIDDEHVSFVCECGRGACRERLALTVEEYERIRDDPRLFALVDGHEDPQVEDVVERNERFTLVRKHEGEPARIARRGAPPR